MSLLRLFQVLIFMVALFSLFIGLSNADGGAITIFFICLALSIIIRFLRFIFRD
jgi:hypothetical protein